MLVQHLVLLASGAFLANALPHLLKGITGERFPTVFSKPMGIGYSSAPVNVVWGFSNLAVAYVLMARIGCMDVGDLEDAVMVASGFLAMAVGLSLWFTLTQESSSAI